MTVGDQGSEDSAKEIALVNGHGVALVDEEDYEELNQHRWYFQKTKKGDGYAIRSRAGVTLSMHRVIMQFPAGLVDHRNGNKLDNRRENLRVATYSLNAFNLQRAGAKSRSGAVGVTWDTDHSQWRAKIRKNGRLFHLGYFDGIGDAVVARRDAEMKYYGEVTPATQKWLAENAA